MTKYRKYKKAFQIACELLNGSILYGYDTDRIFEEMMEKDGYVAPWSYEEFILTNLDRLSGKTESEVNAENEINIFDEIKEATVRVGNKLSEVIESVQDMIQDMIDELEPYQRYELLHPRKKPRGSIRRKRKIRIVYAKDCIEIGNALYEGMMDGFEIMENTERGVNEDE